MTELQLYKFIKYNKIEFHWEDNNGSEDVIMFLNVYDAIDWFKLTDSTLYEDEGIIVTMKHGYFAIWMQDICNHYGIEIKNVFKND